MAESKIARHTPGPWHVNGIDAILSTNGNRSVAKVFHPESDASLLAAAPAMLDVLKLVAEKCSCAGCAVCGKPKNSHHDSPYRKGYGVYHDHSPPAPCLGCQVDAAIKLAEG